MLVIMALMASPLARSFCRAVKATDAVMVTADMPCHGSKADAGPSHKAGHAKADCSVCMALAATVIPQATLAMTGSKAPVSTAVKWHHLIVRNEPLHIGGLGSRAPPVAIVS